MNSDQPSRRPPPEPVPEASPTEASAADARGNNTVHRASGSLNPTANSDVPLASEASEMDEALRFLSPPQQAGELGRLAGYRVLRQLGEGGMGLVLEAEDIKLRRRVALKVMKPEIAKKQQHRERFLREARTAAQVEHDHICPIFQVGDENGVPFIAMPFLKGEALDARLKRQRPLPIDEAVRIVREVAEGLQAAHSVGLVHRDIKPGNVWLETLANRLPRVRILDFGLARARLEEAHLTQSGAIIGTPAYMAPEQARSQPVDHRADLFSLGVMLYEMTTGRRPFTGTDTMSVLTSLAVDTPSSPRELTPAVPESLSNLTMRLLAKKAEQRPASARDVADELMQVLVQTSRPMVEAMPGSAPLSQPSPVSATIEEPWAGIDDASELADVTSQAAVKPSPPRFSNSMIWIAAGVLSLAAIAGIVYLTSRDGPGNDQVAKKEEPKKEPVPIPPRKDKATPSEMNRKAIEDVHTHMHMVVKLPSGMTQTVTPEQPLPAGPFELCQLSCNGSPMPPDMAGRCAAAIAGQKSFTTIADPFMTIRWTENEFAKLADTTARESLVEFKTGLELTPKTVELIGRFPQLKIACFFAEKADDETVVNLAKLGREVWIIIDLGKSGKVTAKGWAALANLPMSEWTILRPRGLDQVALEAISKMPQLHSLTIGEGELNADGIKALSMCPKLVWLNLGISRIDSDAFKHFAGFRSLSNLHLHQTAISDDDVPHLAANKALRNLNLGGTKITETGAKALAAALPRCEIAWGDGKVIQPSDAHYREAIRLVAIPNVKLGLKLADGKVITATTAAEIPNEPFTLIIIERRDGALTDDDLKRLEQTPTLTSLIIPGRGDFSESALRSLLAIQNKLESLYLAQRVLTDECLKEIGDLKELSNLHVGATGSLITDAGIAHLVGLSQMKQLTLHGTGLSDAGVKQLIGLKGLTWLNISDTTVSDASIETLGKFDRLIELNLKGTRITEAGFKKLQAALPKCKIDWEDSNRTIAAALLARAGFEITLNLPDGNSVSPKKPDDLPAGSFSVVGVQVRGAPLTNAELALISRLPALNALRCITGHNTTTEGLGRLLSLKPSLTSLGLGAGPVLDDGLKVIAQLSGLTNLAIDRTRISDAGLAHLAPLAHLEILYLYGTGISDAGLKHLVGFPKLSTLVLDDTAVSDEGLDTLAGMKALTTLYIRNTQITEDGQRKLQAALPKCKISWEARDRGVATSLLSAGGFTVTVKTPDGKTTTATKLDELPEGAWSVIAVVSKGRPFDDDQAILVSQLGSLQTLTCITGQKLTNRGLERLLAVRSTLRSLVLSAGSLTDESLKLIGQFTAVQSLTIDRNPITDAGLAHLAGLKEVSMFVAYNTGITDVGLKHLAGWLKLATLKLANTRIGDDCVPTLSAMKSLKVLSLQGTRFTEKGLTKLKDALPMCKIDWEPPTRAAAERLLARGGVRIELQLPDDKTLSPNAAVDLPPGPFEIQQILGKLDDTELTNLSAVPGIKRLLLQGSELTEAGLAVLPTWKESLTHLDLGGCKITDANLKHIIPLSNLVVLGLNGSTITHEGIVQIMQLKKLEALHLVGGPVIDAGAESLGGMRSLLHLDITGTRISAGGVQQLKRRLPKCTIVWEPPDRNVAAWLLDRGFKVIIKGADGKSLTPAKAADLPAGPLSIETIHVGADFSDLDMLKLETLSSLTEMHLLAGHKVTAKGLEALLAHRNTLTTLSIIDGTIGGAELRVVVQFPNLTHLNFSGAKVADAELKLLSLMKQPKQLLLDNSGVSDIGLAGLAMTRTLTFLSLANTPVTDNGIVHLAKMKSLEILNVKGTRITENGVKRLKSALPECKVEWQAASK